MKRQKFQVLRVAREYDKWRMLRRPKVQHTLSEETASTRTFKAEIGVRTCKLPQPQPQTDLDEN